MTRISSFLRLFSGFSPRFLIWGMVVVCLESTSVNAVEIVPYPSGSAYYNTSDNIGTSYSAWNSGWGTGNTNNGWDYVGQVGGANDASGVYLGNGWVITAGHVGALDFTLGTNTYATNGTSFTSFSFTNAGTVYAADLNLFKISTTSIQGNSLLPTNNLIIPSWYTGTRNTLVMIGYGDASGGRQKSWGTNTVTINNLLVPLDGSPYTTVDFGTAYGQTSYGTNSAKLVVGDSGGGAFIKGGSTWFLAGINQANDRNGNSYFVNLAYYSSEITSVMNAVPEPQSWTLIALGIAFLMSLSLWRRWPKASVITRSSP
jgi:hypothetical protein